MGEAGEVNDRSNLSQTLLHVFQQKNEAANPAVPWRTLKK